ncbi:D-aminoacyl-tRNA deacylase [Membranihabitans maritimus]|uniref:D-aminoacyl-tRNA deacylase n=1 Tax=Membranihabitans maritimus TaxID=2904244 RepID=UPI001F02F70B|nr:D-aminoacyl-tRNA deacylase [Membranihabitans maritimus]
MRVVIQRVVEANVTIKNKIHSRIGQGLLVLFAVEKNNNPQDLDWLVKKIINMRIFADQDNKMNLSVKDINGEILAISQFTLYASTKKGNRPSFLESETPGEAKEIYHTFLNKLDLNYPQKIKSGIFGADMKVSLINDGPVTISIDSQRRE